MVQMYVTKDENLFQYRKHLQCQTNLYILLLKVISQF